MEHIIDAKGKKLGRLASEIAVLLQDKNKAAYEQRKAGSNTVLVKNIGNLSISVRKMASKKYYKHTGPLGHLKEVSLAKKFSENPASVLRHAVALMLPKNRLQKPRLKRLTIE